MGQETMAGILPHLNMLIPAVHLRINLIILTTSERRSKMKAVMKGNSFHASLLLQWASTYVLLVNFHFQNFK